MKRRTTGLVYFLVVVGILIFGTIVVIRTQSERIAIQVGDFVTARYVKQRNLSIDVGNVSGSLLGDITFDDVCISYTGEEAPRILLSARTLSGRINLASLLAGKVKFDSVSVVSPTLVVPLRADGTRIYPTGDPVTSTGDPMSFEIMNIGVTDGSITLEGEEPKVIRDLDAVWSYEQDKRSSTAKIRWGSFTYGEAGVVDDIAGMIHSLKDRIELKGARIRTPHSKVGVSGSFGTGDNDSVAVTARIDSLYLGEIPLFTGSSDLKDMGIVRGRLDASGRYSQLAVESNLTGDVNGWEFDDLIASVLYEKDAIRVDHLTTSLNETPVSFSGEYTMADPPRYEGIIAFSDLDLSNFAEAEDEDGAGRPSDLNGSIRFRGHGLDSNQFWLRTWPRLDQGSYGDYVFDSIGGMVDVDSRSVKLDSLVAGIGASRLEARGRIGFDGGVRLGFSLDCPDVEDMYPYHKVENVHGAVEAGGVLIIGPGLLDFYANSVGRHLDYSGTLVDSLVITVELDEVDNRLTGRAEMFGSDLDIYGLKGSEFIGNMVIDDREVKLERAVLTRNDGSLLGVTGDIEIVEGGFDAGMGNMFVGLGGFIWENEDTVWIKYRPDSLSIGDASFSSGMGRISLLNSSYIGGNYSLETHVDGFDLGLLGEVLRQEVPTGLLDMTLKGSGHRDGLTFDMDFTVEQGEIRAVAFEALTGSIQYDGESLRIDKVALTQNGGSVGIEGSIPVDLAPSRLGDLIDAGKGYDIVEDLGTIAIEARDIDISLLEPLVPPIAKLDGLAELTMEISGNKRNPRVVTKGRLREASYGAARVGDVAWNLMVRDSLLEVVALTFGTGREEGQVSGDVPIAISMLPFSSELLERPIDLRISVVDGDVGLMCELIPKLKVCSGTYGANLRITGDAKAPQFYGDLNLSNARLRFEGVAQDLREISLQLRAEGTRFTLVRMTAEDKSLKATGFFTVKGTSLSDWHFALAFKDFAVTEFEDVYARFDGNVTIDAEVFESGKPVPRIEGDLKIKEGEYFYSLTGGSGEAGEGTIIGPSASPSWVMNLEIEVPNAFWIRGGDIEAELQGDLSVKRGKEGLSVLGTLRTLRGTFYIYYNVFRITRGEFRFTDVTSLRNVYIDLEAQSRVLDEKIDLLVRGRLDELDISATSESGWSETQIFEALTLRRGEASEEGLNNRFFSGEFLRSWGVALVNRFGAEVARELRLDRFGVEVSEVGSGDALAATRVTFGKYVSDKVYLEYTQSLGSLYEDRRKFTQMGLSSPERQLSVEYRLSNRFSIEGETGTIGGLGYFDVDLKFRYGY
ncbi:MAG: translocation/assembly module TamB domain-containing protein [Candidatus Eisenbacteria bacterium]